MVFVHLHNHTEYSLLDGAARVKKLVARAKELDMPAVAITDHGVMYGVINFYQAALKAGVKPIIGCEVYVAQRTRHDRDPRKDSSPFHLVLLAENQEGYRNLCKIVSAAFLEGFYYKPRVDMELLEQHSEGIIALSACIAGELPQLLLQGRREDAKKLALHYQEVFGKDNYFIEIQDHGIEDELIVLPQLVELARELDIPLVATNDLHYVNQSDAEMHDILLCIQTGRLRDDEDRMRFTGDCFYLKTEEEMRAMFPDWQDAIDNTVKIADRCQVDFTFGEFYLPRYEVPDGYTLDSYLEYLCEEGWSRRYGEVTPELRERLNFELDIIEKMQFSGYFLIVWDMIHFARSKGIYVGPGRGSAAGSLVAYLMGITNIDPIKYNLIFERFLNPERISPPDIDTDFCYERRGEVIDYLVEKYGKDNVGQIITFGTMGARGSVKDVGRVLGIPYSDVDQIAKMIPQDPKMTLEKAFKENPELQTTYDSDAQARELLDFARAVEGMPRHSSTHAAGVVIAREEIVNYMPVMKTPDGQATTQFEKEQVEACGLVKMDLLGLRTLTVIGDAVDNILANHPEIEELDMDYVPHDDQPTFDMLCHGDTTCVFQLESDGMRKILRNLHPERFEDIIALVALYRPGPLGSGMVEQFIDSKHGKQEISYPHPLLEPILKETYGVILYQEQVMQIAQSMAGFTLGQADMLRRAMGKKKPEIIAEKRDGFLAGCAERGIDQESAGKVFDLMAFFAGYGFNKSHSAAYAQVSYETAWLKAHYPAEFMAAMMTSVMDTADKVPEYLEECRRMGIEVLPPDINQGQAKFAVADGKIRFALAAVKNVGRDAVSKIVEERNANGPFESLVDLCSRTSMNSKMLENLIKCGALDCLGYKRAQLLEAPPQPQLPGREPSLWGGLLDEDDNDDEAGRLPSAMEKALEIGRKLAQDQDSQQLSLFDFGMERDALAAPEVVLPDIPEYSHAQILAMEKETIGFYVSGHPLDAYDALLKDKVSHQVGALATVEHGEKVRIGGMISNLRHITTQSGKNMAIFTLEDKSESVKCVAFPRTYDQCRDKLFADRVMLVEGKVKKDDARAELVVERLASPGKLYLRLPDSKDKAFSGQVAKLLRSAPGNIEVSVYYNDLKQYFPLPGVVGASMDERLIEALSGTLGDGNVVLR